MKVMDLSLPPFDYKVKKQNGQLSIYDTIRKKYVTLTPEEWVRQHIVHYLINYKHYPAAWIAVEKEIGLYGLKRRFDLVCYDREGIPFLIVECKAPSITLSQAVFDQVFGYNLTLAAPYVAITNGINHYCGHMNEQRQFSLLSEIPDFASGALPV